MGFPGEELLVFNFCPRKGLFSATGVRRTSSQGAAPALAAKTAEAMRTATGQWRPCADVKRSPRQGEALAVEAKARYVMKVHHVLGNPEEETQEVPSDSEEETLEGPSDREDEAQGTPSNSEEETKKYSRACRRADGFGRVGRTRASEAHHQ